MRKREEAAINKKLDKIRDDLVEDHIRRTGTEYLYLKRRVDPITGKRPPPIRVSIKDLVV